MNFFARRIFCLPLGLAILVVFHPSSWAAARTSQTAFSLTPAQQGQLRDLSKSVLEHADRAGCKKTSCAILVANFTGPSGSTAALGIHLADALSAELAAGSTGIRIADRHLLQSFLEVERIPSKLLNEDNAARWLAMENSANAVLVGSLQESAAGLQVRVQLLDAHHLDAKIPAKGGPAEEVTLAGLNDTLTPAEPFGAAPPASQTSDGTAVYKAGAGGVSPPRCEYCPSPSYSDPARVAKFNGILAVVAVISPEGSVISVRIQRGAPFGLNQTAIQGVSTWRFQPAMKDGNPVTTAVPIEVSFRLY